jgi:sialidase-1
VFCNGKVDLLFLEYAVNDCGSISPDNRRTFAMEGIIRHARRLNPQIDIVILYFGSQDMAKIIREGKQPESIVEHELIAQYYGISSLNLAYDLTCRLDADEFTWQQFSGDECHPSAFGSERYFETIKRFLTALWAKHATVIRSSAIHKMPPCINDGNYECGQLSRNAKTFMQPFSLYHHGRR